VHDSIAFYENFPGGVFADAAATMGPYVDAARAGLPELVAELEGLAEGADAGLDALWVLNSIEELWPANRCTTIAAGPYLLHAEHWYLGHRDIVVIDAHPAQGTRFVSPTCAGFLPAVGLSAGGFAQGVDSLPASDDRVGIPRLLISRLAMGAQDLAGAIAATETPGRAGGYGYVFVTTEDTTVVETTATTTRHVEGESVHTNHPVGRAEGGSKGSRDRFARAKELVNEPPASIEDCKAILADHGASPASICRHTDDPYGYATVFALICDTSTGRVVVSDGPACKDVWSEYALDLEIARVE
jgi:isopenicillin-N N-acyltransferase-like protein